MVSNPVVKVATRCRAEPADLLCRYSYGPTVGERPDLPNRARCLPRRVCTVRHIIVRSTCIRPIDAVQHLFGYVAHHAIAKPQAARISNY
jgi:hypothetical protein